MKLNDYVKRRKYDREFKHMVVELSLQKSDIPEIAEELGVKPDLFYRWNREYRALKGQSPTAGEHFLQLFYSGYDGKYYNL